jgi:excisionase family DNA binding protein
MPANISGFRVARDGHTKRGVEPSQQTSTRILKRFKIPDPYEPKVEREEAPNSSDRRRPEPATTRDAMSDDQLFLEAERGVNRAQLILSIHRLVDARKAAELLSCSPRTVRRMAEAGEIPAMRIGNRWRFSLTMLEKWCEERLSSVQRNSCPSERSE